MALFVKLAIDIGTYQTSVWKEGVGLVWSEPTVAAVDLVSRRLLAIGNEAYAMLGKSPEYIEVVRPVYHGVVADFEVAKNYLRHVLIAVMGKSWALGPEVLLSVPTVATQVEQKAVVDVAMAAGARKVRLVDATIAGAIGSKIPVADVYGNMVVNCGAGVTEAAVLALGGVVAVKSFRLGSMDIDAKIADYFLKEHSLLIGDITAEIVKKKYLTAVRPKHAVVIPVSGRDSISGLPKSVELASDVLYDGVRDFFPQLVVPVTGALEATPPELVGDIIDRGVVLLGGGSNLKDIGRYFSGLLNLAVHVGFEPDTAVIKGAGMILENMDVYQRALK